MSNARDLIAMKLAGLDRPYVPLEPEATVATPEQAAKEQVWREKILAMPPPTPGAPLVERQGPMTQEEMDTQNQMMEHLRRLEEQQWPTPQQEIPMS